MSVAQRKYWQVRESLINQFRIASPIINSNLEKIKNNHLEVELKIRNLGLTEFQRIMEFLNNEKTSFPNIELNNMTDYIIDNKRYSIGIDQDIVIQTIKTPLGNNIDDDVWNTRLSLNIENIKKGSFGDFQLSKPMLNKATLIRKKQRTSFINNFYRVDMTYVVNIRNKQITYSHECEIEFIQLNDVSIRSASQLLAEIFNVKQDSEIPYSEKEKGDMIEDLNYILKNISGKRDGLDHTFMAPARNLKYPDVVYGGIIGSQKSNSNIPGQPFKTTLMDAKTNIKETKTKQTSKNEEITYSGTIKADGNRKQFLIYKGGFWLVYPPHDFNLLGRSNDEGVKKLHGFMTDGEDVPLNKRKHKTSTDGSDIYFVNTKYMYIPFDLILLPTKDGKISPRIQESPQLERLGKAREIINSFNLTKLNLTFVHKEFLLIRNTFESLSTVVKELQKQIDEAPYETDGMIFTPNNTIYNTLTDTLRIEERILTLYPDICKLKPWSHQTIDLLVDKNIIDTEDNNNQDNNRIGTLMGRGYGQDIIPFTGSYFNPFDQNTQIDWEHPLFSQISSGVIMEFEPKKVYPCLSKSTGRCTNDTKDKVDNESNEDILDLENNNYIIMLSPKQIRANKPLPNRTDYAATIWDDINDPLEVDTLFGKTFRLLRHSFNKIKKGLYDNIPEGSLLFEIGTGNGGQLSRWKKCSKILGVEPDSKHIEEMWRRLDSYDRKNKFPLKDKVNVIEGGGEETKRIVKEAKKWFGWKKEDTSLKSKKKQNEDSGNLPPFYIVSMLSLSFFWKDLDMLNGLISTIQQLSLEYRNAGGKDVYFIFMTIEGNKVIELFKNRTLLNKNSNELNINLGPCHMKLDITEDFPSLYIDIKDSIVAEQTEYLVNLVDLISSIPLINPKIENIPIEMCMSESEQIYAKLFVSGITKIGNFSNSNPLNQMSDTTSSLKNFGERKSSSPRERVKSTSPKERRKTITSPTEKSTIKKKIASPEERRNRSLSPSSRISNVNRIDFRYTGRDDFQSRRYWLEQRIHEEKDLKIISSTNVDLPAYKQNSFGFSNSGNPNKPVEWQSLGVLIHDDEKNTVYTLPSFLNCILNSAYSKYQETENDEDRMEMSKRLLNDANSQLSYPTRFISNTAQILNPLVKGWLPVKCLYPLAFEILLRRGEIPEAEYVNVDIGDNIIHKQFEFKYYRGKNIQDVSPENIDKLVLVEDSERVIHAYGKTKPSARGIRSRKTETLPDQVRDIIILEDWLIDPKEGIPDYIEEVEVYYEWKGDFSTQEEMLDSIDNEEYLNELLRVDGIDKNSLFYNCRGGILFRYYHYLGLNCNQVKETLKIDNDTQDLFQFAHIIDALAIAVKTFSMPDEDDNTRFINYYNPPFVKEKEETDKFTYSKRIRNKEASGTQVYIIQNRNFCLFKSKFSFYPTVETDDDLELGHYLELWGNRSVGELDKEISSNKNIETHIFKGGLGNINWGNREREFPTVYTYYHHFDPDFRIENGDEEIWEDNDTHKSMELHFSLKKDPQYILVGDTPLVLKGLYIPLGQLTSTGLVRTVFSK